MKNFPIGIQTFSELIKGNYLYIDKTREIYKLFEKGGKYYFLSRPRRFGKSLLISTLKEIFSGNREIFKGLWVHDRIDWQKYPVLHIDFLRISYKTPEILENSISGLMDKIAATFNIELHPRSLYKEKFSELIEKLAREKPVAVLIDEYDKPIIDKIEDMDIASGNREVLKEFYSVLKSADEYIKFAFLTGVSKFSRVSVFSGLNNLDDITLDEKFATLLGYTQPELEHYFQPHIEKMSQTMSMTGEQLLAEIKNWYNGYSWDGKNFLYNPLSILNLFSRQRFDNYWVSTGTPTFLVKLLKARKTDISEFEEKTVDNTVSESYDIDNMGIAPLLFQTGYLTIKEVKTIKLRNKYTLSYPNEEVKETFLKYFLDTK